MKIKATLTGLLTLSFFILLGQDPDYIMTSSLTQINDCSGFFLDSGGGSGNYGPNEQFTTTICPQGTAGTHIQLIFSGPQIMPGDQLCFYDGQTTADPSLGCASDFVPGAAFIIQATAPNTSGCITVTFDSDFILQSEGWSADINCIPACQTITSVLDSSDPMVEPADTGYIDICPGDRVFFTGRGDYPQDGTAYSHSDLTSTFEWDFGDGTNSLGTNVSHVYDEPGGYIVELKITDQLGCQNTNFIKQRIRVAPKPDFGVGDYIDQICSGDTVDLNAMVDTLDIEHTVSVVPGEGAFQNGGIRSDSLPLPDGNGASYSTTISFNNFAPGQVLTDINDLVGIFVNIEHSWMRDLQISITCPDGNSVMLHNHPGQTGGEVFLGIPYENDEGFLNPIPGTGYTYGWQVNPDYNYTWIEYANINNPATLPAGTYESFEPLTNLLGCPLNGDWMIEVTDLWSIDNGNIFSWSIQFDQSLFPDLEKFSPALTSWGWEDHPSIYYQTNDSISGSPVNAGEVAYTFTVEDEFGCTWDTTLEVMVLPYTHPDCYQCDDLLNPFPDSSICLGASVDIDVSTPFSQGEVTFESYDNYEIGASNHPPAFPYRSAIKVNSINPTVITDPFVDIASICLDLETDFDSDISIHLVSPTGLQFPLSTNNGGNGDNYTQTCFSPVATIPITTATAPFTGTFQPEGNWATLIGSPINGDWSLQVSDQFGVNAMGELNWWSITFRTDNTVTYDWTPTTGLSCTDCPNPTSTPAANTNYTVTASDIYGCTTVDEIEIQVQIDYFAPDVQMTALPGGIVEVSWNDVNPGTAYEVNINNTGWVPSNNGNLSHMINGLQFGSTITAQVRSIVMASACTVGIGMSFINYALCTVEAVITSQPPFAVSCQGLCDEAVQLNAFNGVVPFTYSVENTTTGVSFSQVDDGNLVNLCAGQYVVIVSDMDGCMDTVEFEVADQDPIIVNANQLSPVSCFGGNDACATVEAFGGVGGFTYTWNDPNMSLGDTVCGLAAGTAIVTAQDLNGCLGSGVANITEPDLLEITGIAATHVNCKGGNDGSATATVIGGTQPYSYQWSGGDTPDQQSTGSLITGSYTLIVTDGNGCQATGTVQINEPVDGLSLSVTTQRGCFGLSENEAEATVSGGSTPYQYLWTPSGDTTPEADNLPEGNHTVVVTDASGCTISETVFIEDLSEIEVSIAFAPPSCHDGSDGEMAANIVSGGTGSGFTYSWSTGGTGAFINGLEGDQSYSVEVTDSIGCTGTASQLMPNPEIMEPEPAIDDASCNGFDDGQIAITDVANANGAPSFQWDAAAGNQTTSTATGLTKGDYSVVITDTNMCSVTMIYTVGEPTPIQVDFSVEKNGCFGASSGSIDTEVSGGIPDYSFNWSNGGTTAKLTDIPSGEYFVTVTDANLCTIETSVIVEQPDVVSISTQVEDVSCFGGMDGSVTVTADGGTPPYRYSVDNSLFVGSKTLIALAAGDYTVYVEDANGCLYTSDFQVNEPDELSVEILGSGVGFDELTILSGETVGFDTEIVGASGTVQFMWSAAWCGTMFCDIDSIRDCDVEILCPNPKAQPDFANDYYLTIIDDNGCIASDHFQINVRKKRSVVVPTGFTPNGDSVNDMLHIHGRSNTMVKLFQVFDRWGELLYQDVDIPINDMTRGWDGTFKSKDMPPGVYVWYAEAEYEDGMKEGFKGETTLIR